MPSNISISIVNLQKKILVRKSLIIQAVKKVLRHEKIKSAELSIVFVSDARMKSLHKKYLNENHSTDVLSFDFSCHSARPGFHDIRAGEAERPKNLKVKRSLPAGRQGFASFPGPRLSPRSGGAGRMTGEIIISTDTACKNAQIYQSTPQWEIMLYVVHGILHFLGYDDHKASDIQKMRAREQILMDFLSE